MPFPTKPVTLSVEQLSDLNQKLADMRHDINNHLSLIVAAMELIRHKPDSAQRMVATMAEQPSRISASLKKFSGQFEEVFGITRP